MKANSTHGFNSETENAAKRTSVLALTKNFCFLQIFPNLVLCRCERTFVLWGFTFISLFSGTVIFLLKDKSS